MDGWYWHWKNSFSLEGVHETNEWRKNPVQFFIFLKRAGMGNPRGVSHHTWPKAILIIF
jgi:hypothetical protein